MQNSSRWNGKISVGVSSFVLTLFLGTPGYTQTPGTPAAPQRGQRASSPKPPSPMTLKQVIESLSSLKSSVRVESLVAKAGVQFQATPDVVDILKQFGAGPKLISMIPRPLVPPPPPAPKTAGPLTITCEPKDCNVVVDETYEGTTNQSHKVVSGLKAGTTTVQIFAEGYENQSRQIALQPDKPSEEKFSLKRSAPTRETAAKMSLLKTVSTLGGLRGLVDLSDIEGNATMEWTNSDGGTETWTMSFNKHPGNNLVSTFKNKDGQCVASIVGQTSKQECKGGLKNGGDKIASQGTSLFLSYQVQDVLQALLERPLIISDSNDSRVESTAAKDAYVLTIGDDGFPKDLVYQIGNNDPIRVEYSGYSKVNQGWYPKRISLGRVNNTPSWVFTITNVRSRVQTQ